MNTAALIKLEFLKLNSTYNYVLLGIFAMLSFLVVSVLLFMVISVNGQDGGALLPVDDRFKSIYNRLGQLATIIIAILAILNVGTEFKNQSFKRNIMDGLTRNQMFSSKLLGLLILIAAATVLMFLVIVIVGTGMNEIDFSTLLSNVVSVDLLRLLVRMVFAAGLGLLFITIFRTSSFAILGLIGYLGFEMILGLLEKLRFQTDYCRFLPHNFVTETISLANASAPELLLAATYITIVFIISWIIFNRRDL